MHSCPRMRASTYSGGLSLESDSLAWFEKVITVLDVDDVVPCYGANVARRLDTVLYAFLVDGLYIITNIDERIGS